MFPRLSNNQPGKEFFLQSIESWISEDWAKSGLTGEDIEVLPLMPKIKRDGSIIHHGGYQIIYRDAQGVPMKGCRNQPFVRERFSSAAAA